MDRASLEKCREVAKIRVLIGPWGNPASWPEVKYEFEDILLVSNTSLKILQEVVRPDKIVILGLDTLAEKGNTYSQIRNDAKKVIETYSKSWGLRNVEVVICPGIGDFPNGRFKGSALDFYYYVLAVTSLELLQGGLGDVLEVHLDLTHGINFTTILAYRAIKEVLGIFSIFKQVRFVAYNADPFIRNVTEKVFMNIVEEQLSFPRPLDEKNRCNRLLEPVNLDDEAKKDLFKRKLAIHEYEGLSELSAFIGALYNGLPLALFTYYPPREQLKEVILRTLSGYEENIVTGSTNGKIMLGKNVQFGNDFKIFVLGYLVSELLYRSGLVQERQKEVRLRDLKRVTSDLFEFDPRFKNRIEKDVNNLENKLSDKELTNWQLYYLVTDSEEKEEYHSDERNFLAHSGLEKNAIEVKKQDNEILIRYRDKTRKAILRYCQKGLK